MSSTAETIETIFVTHTKELTALGNHVYPNERADVDRKLLPMVTMFFLLPQGVEAETGPTEEVDYRWDIYLYVALSDYETAQTAMKKLSCDLVTNFRQHRSDYDLSPDGDFFARSLRRKEPPTPASDNSFLRAAWELQVTVGEE